MGNVVVYEWGLNSDFLKTVAGLPSWPVVLGTAVIMLIILYSAALSADAGERRGYNDIAFFIMGMVLPYIFPLVIVPAISPVTVTFRRRLRPGNSNRLLFRRRMRKMSRMMMRVINLIFLPR